MTSVVTGKKYSVAIYGTGKRGKVHAETFHKDDRFQVVAICGRNQERLAAAAPIAGNPDRYLDAARMLRKVKPDVFCFCTPGLPGHIPAARQQELLDESGDKMGGASQSDASPLA